MVDQFSVTASPSTTDEGVAEKLTIGAGGGKVWGACGVSVEAGVLPPPQPLMAIVMIRIAMGNWNFRKFMAAPSSKAEYLPHS